MEQPIPGPIDRYQRDLLRPDFAEDSAQRMAVDHLQVLFDALLRKPESQGVFAKWLRAKPQRPLIKGLYFWGGVGRGKTYLMDVFFESLPFAEKRRLHFHRFMRLVHEKLRAYAGQSNPLDAVADELLGDTRILCLDEFFVVDITDAMILANLFEALFANGLVLVTTSNIEPSGLYKDGLQRARFLPTIALLEQHCEVVNVDGGVDYRLRELKRLGLYYTPLSADSRAAMDEAWAGIVPDAVPVVRHGDLQVSGRGIAFERQAEDVIWFTFSALCEGPRSQNDYIDIAREFHTVLISDVPEFAQKDDAARRFINLIDEFYDRSVKLVLSAEAPLQDLYVDGRLSFEFERTCSRLLEMQSAEYLALPHRP